MTGLEGIARVYCSLYINLVQWITQYVGREDAKKIVLRALATMFRLACNAYETPQGPYADLCDQVLAGSIQHGFIDPLTEQIWPLSNVPIPSTNDLYEIAHLYSLVYHACYSTQWSMAEREHIYQWIRLTVPLLDLDEQNPQAYADLDSMPAPLRRAVDQARSTRCDGELICQVSDDIWRIEHQKGQSWLHNQVDREAIAPWLK